MNICLAGKFFDLRKHIDSMTDEGHRPTTINRKKAVLSSVYKFALNRGYVDTNIVRNVVIDDSRSITL